jgi:predicted nucleotidyltransferase
MPEAYTYITPTIETPDPRMRKALDGWLGLYEACYVMAQSFSEGHVVADGEAHYGNQSAPRPQPKHLLAALINGAKALNEWNGNWVLGGGLAMNYYGRDRATRDVDFFLLENKDNLAPVIEKLSNHELRLHTVEQASFMPPEALWWWVPLQFGMPDAMPVDVDLLVASNEFMAFIHATGKEDRIEDTRVRIIGPEALIVLKLQANRHQDLGDLEDLLRLKPNLDRDLLSAWVKKFGLEARLAEIERIVRENPGRRG